MHTPIRRSRMLLAAGACLLTAMFVVQSDLAHGSTPAAGTVTDTSSPATWTGGPFLVPNATGTAGAVDCTAPQSCDDYSLTVTTPAGTGDTKNLKISVGWQNSAADFDVYVLDSAGNQVASAASSADPETVLMPPTSGTYTVRVVPFLPLGQSYSASAAVVAKPSDTPPTSAAPTPAFTNYGAPEALTDSHNAGEPSIGVSDQTNSSFYQSYVSTYRVRFDDSVSPATAAWSDVSAKAANGCPQGSTTSLDPILYTDRTTGRTFESQLSGVDSLTCYTDDEGATWHPSQGGGIPSGVDHQTLGGGPFVAGDPLNATNLYPRAVYYCSQDIATAFCALSRNGGITFGAGVPIYSLLDCGGLHGHVQVAPDGTAYVPNKSCNGHQGVAVSSDDGTTWAVHTIPNSVPSDSDPAVGIGSNGTAYVGYANGDGTPHVAVSHDRGATWTHDFNVGAALGIKNTVFPTAVAGNDDRAAISFLGTTTAGNYQDAANFHGVWHLYTAFTYDGGASWVTVDDTPTDPVQRGSICTAGTTCGNDRNLLDFIGSTIDNHGRVEVAYADGCTGACVTGTTNNFDAYATIARQSSGQTLYAAYDPAPNLTISSLTATPGPNGQYTLTARLANLGTGAATAPVKFLVDGTPLATSATTLVPAGGTTNLTAIWHLTGKSKAHTITAIADPANTVRESNENDNRRSITFTA
jgi:CARDB